jgi:hypothetical protein
MNLAEELLKQNKERIEFDYSGELPEWAIKMCEGNLSNSGTAGGYKENADAEKIKQCGDCRHNWNYINMDGKSGWCYMFSNYMPNCAQKIQIDGK